MSESRTHINRTPIGLTNMPPIRQTSMHPINHQRHKPQTGKQASGLASTKHTTCAKWGWRTKCHPANGTQTLTQNRATDQAQMPQMCSPLGAGPTKIARNWSANAIFCSCSHKPNLPDILVLLMHNHWRTTKTETWSVNARHRTPIATDQDWAIPVDQSHNSRKHMF